MEPSWPKWPGKTIETAQLDPLKLKVFQKWRLGGLRARFWRPRTRFWRPRNSIWEGSGTIFSRFLARMPRKPRTPRTPAKTRPRSQMHQESVGGGASPPGGFNPPPTEGVQGVLNPNHIAYNQSSRSYHKWPSSWWQAQVLRSRLLHPSLFLSPGAWGPPPTLRQEAEKWDLVAFFFDFLPFQVAI